MIAKSMETYVRGSSVIRAMFEEGRKLAAQFGPENVYDFSLGNPSVEPPAAVKEAVFRILEEEPPNLVHGYMSNSGYADVCEQIAASANAEFGTSLTGGNIIMTVGAAGAINIVLKSILDPGDEVIALAPYFAEYNNYVANYGGTIVSVPPDWESFQINLTALEAAITPRTRAIIINSPNNPTGVVYSEATLQKLAELLNQKQKVLGTCIYLISDEPYRRLVYGDTPVPYVTRCYQNTLVAYSFSKALSLPGERIGYLVVPSCVDGFDELMSALTIANRILGFVNAPSLFQRVIGRCIDLKIDLTPYRENRDLLYDKLLSLGFSCVKPDGAFYLFPKALETDDKAFCDKAKKYNLLLVPGSAFAGPGHFRIAYCVPKDMILRSFPSFEKLAAEYR